MSPTCARKVYVAGPLQFQSSRVYLERIEAILKRNGFDTWSPYKDSGFLTADDLSRPEVVARVLGANIAAFEECVGAVFLLDGCSTGTIFELGYAYCLAKNTRRDFVLIGLYSSLRGSEGLDPMVAYALGDVGIVVTSLADLEGKLTRISGLKHLSESDR
jgi:hypothetical protein